MNRKTFNIIVGFAFITVALMIYFNISLSLPTTFSEMVDKQIEQDQQLTINKIDYERIDMVRIESPTEDVVEIEDKDVMSTIFNNELRIYNGGRYEESNEEYDLYIYFYGSQHSYTIAEDYIETHDGNYIVLDENNEIFDYIKSLFEEK